LLYNHGMNESNDPKIEHDYSDAFSRCFKHMRELKELTQGELAEEIGISRQSVNAIEKGKSLPSIDLASEIAQFFDTSIDMFLRFDEEFEKSFENNNKSRFVLRHSSAGEVERNPNKEYRMQDFSPFKPLRESVSLREAMDRLLEDSVISGGSLPSVKINQAIPAVEMYETEKDVVAKMHVPGFAEEDVDVEVDDKAIYITGECKDVHKESKRNYLHREIVYGKFSRTLAIPVKVQAEKAKADFDKGVLTISLPKIEEKKPKTVKIKISSKK
jgi:HSP20 family protein